MDNSRFATGPAPGQYALETEDQLQPEDTLVDRGVEDVLDEGYSPPDRPVGPGAYGPPENMDQLLAEEEPDPAARLNVLLDDAELCRSDAAEQEAEFPLQHEVGQVRAGRLVAPDEGFGCDEEPQLIAQDVGFSGGAASAEEAAVHIIDDVQEPTAED